MRLRHRTARTCQRLLQTLGVDSSSPRDRIRFPLALLCTAVAPLLTGYVRLNSLPTQRPARATLDHTSFLLISISAMTTMIPRFSAHQCRAFSASRATCRYSQRYHPQWRRARRSADLSVCTSVRTWPCLRMRRECAADDGVCGNEQHSLSHTFSALTTTSSARGKAWSARACSRTRTETTARFKPLHHRNVRNTCGMYQ